MTAPADEFRAAVRLLRNPYNCLPQKDLTADLLEVIGEFADEYDIHEHPDGEPCDDFACRIVAAALVVARAQPGIEEALTQNTTNGRITRSTPGGVACECSCHKDQDGGRSDG